jgi:hypothetical protein
MVTTGCSIGGYFTGFYPLEDGIGRDIAKIGNGAGNQVLVLRDPSGILSTSSDRMLPEILDYMLSIDLYKT